MGQTRPVTAIKFMIKNSIEEKLDKIQKKKANLANLSLKPMTRKELMDQKVSWIVLRSDIGSADMSGGGIGKSVQLSGLALPLLEFPALRPKRSSRLLHLVRAWQAPYRMPFIICTLPLCSQTIQPNHHANMISLLTHLIQIQPRR